MLNRGMQAPPTSPAMLVVEDQLSVCVSLAYLLELAGFRPLTAASGAAAIALANREHIDGALIDVHMPAMDGFAVCQQLQSQARNTGRELRVWFMTGVVTRFLVRRSVELGAYGVLPKPFEFKALSDTLREGFASPIPLSISETNQSSSPA